MAASNYQPAYAHVEWLDNVDRVEAGGGHGFNAEFEAIQAEFTTLARVLGGPLTLPSLVWGNNSTLSSDQGGSIELGGDNSTPGIGTPYIDFHYGNQQRQDFSTRLINDGDAQLTVTSQIASLPTGDRHSLVVHGETGIQQERLFISGGTSGNTWSSIGFNCHHCLDGSRTQQWQFPDPSHTAVTLEMDAANGSARFEIYTTPTAATTSFQRRLAIDGDSGLVTVDHALEVGGSVKADGGLRAVGVSIGYDAGGLGYPYAYETVGVALGNENLRLQSPNNVYTHARGAIRTWFDAAGNLMVGGAGGSHESDPTWALPAWSGGGLLTWDAFVLGTLDAANFSSPNKALRDRPSRRRGAPALRHACLEGPESAVYYRGEGSLVDRRAVVKLPRYFEALTRVPGRSVLLTPKIDPPRLSAFAQLAASAVVDGQFEVIAAEGGDPEQEFYWEVKAERADVERLDVEPLS